MIELLRKKYPTQFGFSVSHTTRKPVSCDVSIKILLYTFLNALLTYNHLFKYHLTILQREGEQDKVHYNFTTVDTIKKEIDEGKFIEYANVHGNYYGTSVAAVESVSSTGKICILDIDVQGVQNVKKSSLDAIYIFIAPPSMEELEKRLRGRGTETEEAVLKRIKNAKGELEYGTEENFDRVFTNDDLDKTFDTIVSQFQEWYPQLK